MDSSVTGSGPGKDETHRQFLQFLRGLRELDAAVGPWRPDYGRLPAAAMPDSTPTTEAAVIAAHRRYTEGLRFLADHPEATQALGGPAADDVAAALADAHIRFGAPAVPLEWFIPGGVSPVAAPPPPPPPPPPLGAAGREAGTAAPEMRVSGGRIAQSPWEMERAAGRGMAERGPAARREAPASGRRDLTEGEPAPRGFGRGFAIGMSLAALAIMAILVAAFILGAHAFLGQGPTAAPAASVPPATLPASDVPTGSPAAVLAPLAACTAIPTGKIPSALALSSTTSGIGTDPAVGYSNPFVAIHLAGTVGSGTPAFSLITVVLPYEATAPATSPPIDGAGTVQLIAYWSGDAWVGAFRSRSGSTWTLSVGPASGVDVFQAGAVVTLYWQGLVEGDRYGVVVAASGACAALGTSAALAPQLSYGAQATP